MALSEIDILRRGAGDTDPNFECLSDEYYQQIIDTIPSNVTQIHNT